MERSYFIGWKDMYDEDKNPESGKKKESFMGGKWGYTKVYIDVIVLVRANGKIRPLALIWDDAKYNIDKFEGPFQRPPQYVWVTGPTLRFGFYINGKKSTVYYEENTGRWFVEKPGSKFDKP